MKISKIIVVSMVVFAVGMTYAAYDNGGSNRMAAGQGFDLTPMCDVCSCSKPKPAPQTRPRSRAAAHLWQWLR